MLYIFICINTFWQYTNVQQTVLYLTTFLPYERTSAFYCNLCTRGAYSSGNSRSRYDMKLNFVPVIPRIKELQSVALTSSKLVSYCHNELYLKNWKGLEFLFLIYPLLKWSPFWKILKSGVLFENFLKNELHLRY